MEAWTRDDKWVNAWYEMSGFVKVESYFHVFIDGGKELSGAIKSEIPNLYPVQVFAHYVADDSGVVKNRFKRVHECICYEKVL